MSINREGKIFVVVAAIVASIIFGINYMVSEEPDQNWLIIAIGLLLLALLFWLWIRRDDNVSAGAEANALEATEKAEAVAADAKAKAEQAADTKAAEEAAKDKAEQAALAKAKAEQEAKEKAEQEAKEKAEQEALAKAKAEQEAKEKAEQEALAKAKAEQETKEKAEAATRLAGLGAAASEKAAAASEPDDLTRVEGVGPKYRDALIAAGIDTFAKLAAASMDDIQEAAKTAGMRNTRSMETWSEQAGLAAKGDWDGLEKLQGELSGGRRD